MGPGLQSGSYTNFTRSQYGLDVEKLGIMVNNYYTVELVLLFNKTMVPQVSIYNFTIDCDSGRDDLHWQSQAKYYCIELNRNAEYLQKALESGISRFHQTLTMYYEILKQKYSRNRTKKSVWKKFAKISLDILLDVVSDRLKTTIIGTRKVDPFLQKLNSQVQQYNLRMSEQAVQIEAQLTALVLNQGRYWNMIRLQMRLHSTLNNLKVQILHLTIFANLFQSEIQTLISQEIPLSLVHSLNLQHLYYELQTDLLSYNQYIDLDFATFLKAELKMLVTITDFEVQISIFIPTSATKDTTLLTLYQITQTPIFEERTTINTDLVKIKLQLPSIALAKNQEYYITLDKADCTQNLQVYTCSKFYLYKSVQSGSCVLGILMNDQTMILEYCEFLYYQVKGSKIYVLPDSSRSGNYLISTNIKANYYVHCYQTIPRSFKLESLMKVDLNCQCTLVLSDILTLDSNRPCGNSTSYIIKVIKYNSSLIDSVYPWLAKMTEGIKIENILGHRLISEGVDLRSLDMKSLNSKVFVTDYKHDINTLEFEDFTKNGYLNFVYLVATILIITIIPCSCYLLCKYIGIYKIINMLPKVKATSEISCVLDFSQKVEILMYIIVAILVKLLLHLLWRLCKHVYNAKKQGFPILSKLNRPRMCLVMYTLEGEVVIPLFELSMGIHSIKTQPEIVLNHKLHNYRFYSILEINWQPNCVELVNKRTTPARLYTITYFKAQAIRKLKESGQPLHYKLMVRKSGTFWHVTGSSGEISLEPTELMEQPILPEIITEEV